MHKNERVAIIGGGPAGVGAGKWLRQYDIDFDVFEKESRYGGLWNIDSADARRVYKSAHLISCKSITEMSDLPMPKSYPAYPNNELMRDYIADVGKQINLEQSTLFNTKVVHMTPVEDEFELALETGETRRYGAVLLATGLLNKPVMPSYPGAFKGISMHSKEYIEIDPFKDKRVLVIGSGNSGCDIAVDLCRYADKVYHSARRAYHYMPKFIYGKPTQEWMMQLALGITDPNEYWRTVREAFQMAGFAPEDYGLPTPDHPIYACHPIVNSQILFHIGHGDIFYKPDVLKFDGKKVYFVDGSDVEIDVVIYATGFRPDFPFLDPKQFNVANIFEETFTRFLHKKYDNLFFLGYFNSPAGLGNLLNSGGKLLALLLKAYFSEHEILNVIQRLKLGPEPDLGNGGFIHSDRHRHEYDLWKTAKFMRSMIDRIEGAL